MRKISSILAAALLLLAACGPKEKTAERGLHPDWTYNSVVYEVNVRQYSPEGTFEGVRRELPRLKELGVDVLWLMPMYRIGEEERKGTLGSYYAISDYTKVNPEFGTMEDFQALLDEAHSLGLKVILDWVANQTAPDHVWMTTRPADYYERDEQGNAVYEYDWTDTRSLNYENEAVWAAQDSCMRFWLEKGVDGFRCDAAGEVPAKFWKAILPQMKKDYPDIYLLAEAEKPELTDPAETFDANYGWELHHILNDVAQGKKTVADIKAWVEKAAQTVNPAEFILMFTSNHDENSWAGTEFERMGAAAEACQVICFTLPKSQPLVYTGQEIGLDRRLQFFEKDPIEDWSANAHTEFFKKLIAMRHDNAGALSAGERGGEIVYLEGVPESVLAYSREAEGNKVIVLANMSAGPVELSLDLGASFTDAFSSEACGPEYKVTLEPWGYRVLSAKNL
ncbi:MAG: alpha-amylase family glycosyl hydrolase [Candidatus Cryptobacteroides sp.]